MRNLKITENLSLEEKKTAFKENRWSCAPPPRGAAIEWEDVVWFMWIDRNGHWWEKENELGKEIF